MAVQHMPSPAEAAPIRIPRLMGSTTPAACTAAAEALAAQLPADAAAVLRRTEASLLSCSTADDAPVVVYVSKMVSVPVSLLPRAPGEALPPGVAPDQEVRVVGGRKGGGARGGIQAQAVLGCDVRGLTVRRPRVGFDGKYLRVGLVARRTVAAPHQIDARCRCRGAVALLPGLHTARGRS